LILSVAESFTVLLVGYIFAGAFCATIGVWANQGERIDLAD